MAITTFPTNQSATVAKWNAAADDLPKSVILFAFSGRTVIVQPTSYPAEPQIRVKVRPTLGDYLHVLMDVAADATADIDVKITLTRGAYQDTLHEQTGIDATGFIINAATAITALTNIGDATCEDCELSIFFRRQAGGAVFATVYSLVVRSGQAATGHGAV